MSHQDKDLKDLSNRLSNARTKSTKQTSSKIDKTAGAMAYRLVLELLISIGLGGFLGYQLDVHSTTSPWGLVIGLLIGITVGFYTVIKDVMRLK